MKSIILLKKKRGLLDIHREILFNETVYNPRDTYATSLKASRLKYFSENVVCLDLWSLCVVFGVRVGEQSSSQERW